MFRALMARIGAVALAAVLVSPVDAQRQPLPPVSYVCPMPEHAHVLEDKAGKCPLCEMALEPTRIELVFTCMTHAAVIRDTAGLCPLDRKPLMPVTVSLYWTCADTPKDHLLTPGRCADGSARKRVREPRAHGDHNPKHGGQFFMASDKWHHVEATYPSNGVVRVFFYDNFTKAMPARGFAGRVVLKETFDPKTRAVREEGVIPLMPSKSGQTLDALLPTGRLPLQFALKVKFDPKLGEERFDFVFDRLSAEPAPVPATTPPAAARRAPAPKARASTPPAGPPAAEASLPAVPAPTAVIVDGVPAPSAVMIGSDGSVETFEVRRKAQVMPRTAEALASLLGQHRDEVKHLLTQGQFGALYIPALLSKDVALAFQAHVDERPATARGAVTRAIAQVVRSAFQIDAFGDMGNRQQLERAFTEYSKAVDVLREQYAAR